MTNRRMFGVSLFEVFREFFPIHIFMRNLFWGQMLILCMFGEIIILHDKTEGVRSK